MLKRIFRQQSEIPFNSLQDDLGPADVAIDVNSQAKISRILRYSINKPTKETPKERSRTLHTLSLSRLQTNDRSLGQFCPRNGEIGKVIANLKRLKSLRCLNIDLCWLLTIKKGHAQFVESLKHLKNLSVIHFYVKEERVFLCKIPHLYQSLCKVPIKSKAKVQFSLFYYGIYEGSFHQLLGAMNNFGCLTSVHLTFKGYDSPQVQEILALLQDEKSISRIDITVVTMWTPYASDPGPLLLFENLKHVKSLKKAKITFTGLAFLTFAELEFLIPKLKEVIQFFNLDITFRMNNEIEHLRAGELKKFVESIQKSGSRYKFCGKYIGQLKPSLASELSWPILILLLAVLAAIVIISCVSK